MNEIVLLCTVNSMESGEKIARALIEAGEAACINIVPGVRSLYRWQGKVCDDAELLLVIKSNAANFDAVRRRIRSLHSYDIPEIIALPISLGDAAYLEWVNEQVSG